MLVVTANWAFSDGSLVPPTRPARTARAWLGAVHRAAIRSGFGVDGRYRPPTDLDIVLAGDTFDGLTSAEWSGRDRPWHRGVRAAAARQRVILDCARRAAPLLAGLARLARSGVAVPAADHRGRPAPATLRRVPVRVTMLPGDRDRHVAELVASVEAHGGTVTPAWSDDSALVAHGHEFDPTCHVAELATDEDRPPSLAESVTVDLVVPFAAALARGGVPRSAHASLVAALAGADVASIPTVVAAWSAANGPGAVLDSATSGAVATAWSHAVDTWLRTARREPPDCGLPASPLDALAAWFRDAAAGDPPPVLAALFAADPPPARGSIAGSRDVVLGHPLPVPGTDRPVCLGRPPVRRWGVVAVVRGNAATDVACVAPLPATEPLTVIGVRRGERPEWHRLRAEPFPGRAAAGPAAVVDAA